MEIDLTNLPDDAGALKALVQQLSRPKRIVRGPDGRAQGVE